MSIPRKNLMFLLTLAAAIIVPECFIHAEDSPVPGGICSEPQATHYYTSDIVKTPWVLNELYAVPVGTMSPESWDQSPYFSVQFNAELQSGETSEAFAQACGAVWYNFFTDDAAVIVSLSRTITATNQTLQCISGNWISVSTEYLQFNDVSDWLTTNNSAFDVSDPSSTPILQADLQKLLENLNAQPGAASDPEE